jgi:hypothetical protein
MGRAAGWPARFGRGAVRNGMDGEGPGVSTAGGAEAREGWGICGIGAAGIPDGRGWRGPESI